MVSNPPIIGEKDEEENKALLKLIQVLLGEDKDGLLDAIRS